MGSIIFVQIFLDISSYILDKIDFFLIHITGSFLLRTLCNFLFSEEDFFFKSTDKIFIADCTDKSMSGGSTPPSTIATTFWKLSWGHEYKLVFCEFFSGRQVNLNLWTAPKMTVILLFLRSWEQSLQSNVASNVKGVYNSHLRVRSRLPYPLQHSNRGEFVNLSDAFALHRCKNFLYLLFSGLMFKILGECLHLQAKRIISFFHPNKTLNLNPYEFRTSYPEKSLNVLIECFFFRLSETFKVVFFIDVIVSWITSYR